jgi:hypothetical protein
VRPLDCGVELDATVGFGESHPQLDVLDRGLLEPAFVKATEFEEIGPADRADPAPEGRGRPRVLLMHMVMQQIAEGGHDAGRWWTVVVRPEDRRQLRVRFEALANTAHGICMQRHVCIDEDENVAGRDASSGISCCRGACPRRLLDDEELLGRIVGGPDRRHTPAEARWAIRRRHDCGKPGHAQVYAA